MGSSIHYGSRLSRLRSLMESAGVCSLLVAGESNVFYFTGYRGAGYLFLSGDSAHLIVPLLEYRHAADYLSESGLERFIDLVVYAPYGLPGDMAAEEEGFRVHLGGLADTLKALSGGCEKCGMAGVESVKLYRLLSEKCGTPHELDEQVWRMRMVKEAWEIDRITVASRITEAAVATAFSYLDRGVSEAEVAGLIYEEFRRRGADGQAFPSIVAFGDNSVYPHAMSSTSRVLTGPTVVLIDAGAKYMGYCSDMTRTSFYDATPPEFRHVAESVLEAMDAALEAAGPGVKAEEVDAAARRVLEKYGLAKYFIHSLGHGVGVDIHEPPRVTYKSSTVLEPGMVITIEPGVYLPGRFGVRIEDTVLITHRKALRLTRLERSLWL